MQPEELQTLLGRLLVMPVFTAHPTEAKRRTLLTKLGRVAETLHAFDFHSPTPDEARGRVLSLREEIVSLWQTDDTRTYRPSVLDEVRNGLYYFESTLFDLAPEIERRLGEALARRLSRRSLRRSRLPEVRKLDRRRSRRQPLRHPRGRRKRRSASTRLWPCASTGAGSNASTAT